MHMMNNEAEIKKLQQPFPRKVVGLAVDPIIHENYRKPIRHSNDIALLKLAEDVGVKMYQPICLPPLDADYTGKVGLVYGWNFT